jgi:Fur family transcriptional regulator, ferric uptake regulator
MTNQELRKAGLKVTLPRVRILEILEKAKKKHLSAEDIFRVLQEAGEDASLATIYRVLTQFEDAGLVTRHNFEGDHAVFELKADEHHDHLVCVKCGLVEEFVDAVIEKRQKKVAEEYAFEMTDHVMNIYGFCRKCQKQ